MFRNFSSFCCESSNGGLVGYYVHHPKDVLTAQEKNELFMLLYPVALSAFGKQDNPSAKEDVHNHLFSGDGLIVVMDNDRAVAFRMWNVFTHETEGMILYLAGMCVHREYQGKGIGSSLLHYVLNHLQNCVHVVLRTQSPVMKKCFDQAIGAVSFPNGDEIPDSVKNVGAFVARCLKDNFYDKNSLISVGVYGSSLYESVPVTCDTIYQLQFDALNQGQGDAMMCIWKRGP
jgi:GNAT superfamily N-acetyltransferase